MAERVSASKKVTVWRVMRRCNRKGAKWREFDGPFRDPGSAIIVLNARQRDYPKSKYHFKLIEEDIQEQRHG